MRKLLTPIFLLFLCSKLFSQSYSYGNEWINYNQQYFKIKIYKEGIYRLDSTLLSSAGVPLSSIDPRNFQLYINGQEQFIYIKGDTDGVFNQNDYIEFYGRRNDAGFDSSMYYNVNFLPNPWHSVVQDTAAAFLTWNTSLNNKRYSIVADTSYSSYTPAQWFYHYSVVKLRTSYSHGSYNMVGAYDPRYTPCEGWVGAPFIAGTSYTLQIPTPSAFTGGPDAKITAVYLSLSANYLLKTDPLGDHHLISEWKDNSGIFTQVRDTILWGFNAFKDTIQVPGSQLASTTEFKITSVAHPTYNAGNTHTSAAYGSAWYPQTYNLQNRYTYKLFIPDETSQSVTLANYTGLQSSSSAALKAYDLTNGTIAPVQKNGTAGKFILPNTGNVKEVLLTTSDSTINVTQLANVNGTGSFVNYSSQAMSDAFVIVTHSKLQSAAQQYKAYRQTLQGGGYNVLVADIDDLYDQFAYGINKHPKSIRNFMKFLMDSFPSQPKYLFLLAKSVAAVDGFYDPASYSGNLVPSWGTPCADNLILAGLNGTFLEPAIPTGRLSAGNQQNVLNYLQKVQAHDSWGPELWQKNVIHFVGGIDQNEIVYFKQIMDGYKSRIEDTLFGANVTTFVKNTSAPVQTSIPQTIIDMVDNGTSLLTFYGHGSNQSFDFDINDPTVFSNTGKYPVLLSNSCYSGNIHLRDTMSLSERYVMVPNKGTVAFIASVSLGVAQFLQYYSDNFYRHCASLSYGQGVGDICKQAITQTQYLAPSAENITEITCMEMTLHGDPAVKINLFTKPDFAITNSDLYFNTSYYVDSIQVNLRISNLSRAVNDSIYVRVTRTYPNGTPVDYFRKIKAPAYIDTLSFFIPADAINAGGVNQFTAYVDFYDDVDEIDNFINNQITTPVSLFVNGDDIVPVYPYEFEVIPLANTVRLKASTINPFAAPRNYIFQVDTTDSFTNPIAVSPLINSGGGVVEWTANLLPFSPNDSIVYFWRVSRDSIDATGYNWRESSFQMIDSLYGWEQAHFFQFKKDRFKFVDYKKPQRLFQFPNNVNGIDVHNGFYNFYPFLGAINDVDLTFAYNGNVEHAASRNPSGWTFIIIDSVSGILDSNYYQPSSGTYQYGTCSFNQNSVAPIAFFDFGNYHQGNVCNVFPLNSPELGDSIASFLQNIPFGKYVLGISINYWRGLPMGNSWNSWVYNEFDSFGVSGAQLSTLADSVPVVFLGRRGLAPGTAHVEIGSNRKDVIDFTDSITASWDRGYITSTIIGPAYEWHSIHWRYKPIESVSKDTVYVSVVGIKANGLQDTLMALNETQQDVTNIDTLVDASVYPYIKLVASIKDDSLNSAPQLRRWHVIYSPAPEGALHAAGGFTVVNDTLQEGDSLAIVMPFKNVSEFVFRDSLLYTYAIEDAAHVFTQLTDKLKPDSLMPDDVVMDTIRVSTEGFAGQNGFWIDVNAIQHQKHQWEQAHFNNFARVPFTVSADKINPILDVTFDGVHIMNKDIVSSKPDILISLKDENKFLALNDTADFEVYLKWPGSGTEKRMWFCPSCPAGSTAGQQLGFEPAQLPKNSCKITFRPDLLQDGVYTLRVKAEDRSSNQSGSTDYKIQFEVVNKPSVTQILNYPNPFSTSTRFVFTLTGSEVPEMFMIQIMTISGKVVREIRREELGNIHIGRNITEYAWDGKDEFGDPLANGVYLYRVVTRLNGEKIENRESGADQYFIKELGKMVIIR